MNTKSIIVISLYNARSETTKRNGDRMMKKLFLILSILLTITPTPLSANDSIPAYHWTYHSLEILSDRSLINERVDPGESSYTKEQTAEMIVYAFQKISAEPSLMSEDILCAMRQLINGYRNELGAKGRDFEKMRTKLEDLALAAGLSAVETGGPGSKERPLNFQAAKAVSKFTFDIYRYMAAKSGDSLFISPYSISSALSMTYAGAAGETAGEMRSVLHFDPDMHRSMAALINDINSVPEGTAAVKTANALWPAKDEKLLPKYKDMMSRFYGALLTALDYRDKTEEARTTMNKWVEKETGHKIKNLIGDGILNKDTLLVLTNAVWFRSDWVTKFEPGNSRAMPFYATASEQIPTVMMTKTESGIRYLKEDGIEIAEIPYKDNRISMLVLLPQKGTDLRKIDRKLDYTKFTEWATLMSPHKVKLTIPKFKTEQSFELSEALKGLGITEAFDPGRADFSGMNGKRNMYIGAALHKTFIEVGEEGTEAAAATAVIMTKTSMNPDTGDIIEFKADRPFIYIIRDNGTGAILFIGRYAKP